MFFLRPGGQFFGNLDGDFPNIDLSKHQGKGFVMHAATVARSETSTYRYREPHLSNIADLLEAQDILLDLEVVNKAQLFETIDQHMVQAHGMAKGFAAMSLNNRERIGSTGLGDGVAVPHAHVKNLQQVHLLYIRLKSPMAFDAPDGNPVRDVLVLLVPHLASQQHLDILAEMTQVFPNRGFRQRLHQCGSPTAVKQLFDAWQPD